LATASRHTAYWVTIVSALLLISAQAFAHGHLHVGLGEPAPPDCTECALAKVPLTLVGEAANLCAAETPTDRLPPPGAAELLTVSSRFHGRAREPPPA
jgi:hypothetical protein